GEPGDAHRSSKRSERGGHSTRMSEANATLRPAKRRGVSYTAPARHTAGPRRSTLATGATASMPKGSVSSRPRETEPRVRRGYFECRFGQLHVHNAIPPGGGFEEGTAVLCLHPAGQTGRAFKGLLPQLGRDRSVYAPDIPGSGESDGPAARASVME